jgi:hypothetical protein
MRKVLSISIVFAIGVLVLSALPAVAQVAGPIEVFANSFQTSYPQGGVTDLGCEVANHSLDSTVGVLIDANVTYADGRTQRILGPTRSTLDPNSNTILFIASAVPADAALGTAVFACSARVTQVTGGTNHGDYGGGSLVGVDTAPFEVVP